jgi:hypothetical protein
MSRIAFETDMQVDFMTDNLLVKGYERYSFATTTGAQSGAPTRRRN